MGFINSSEAKGKNKGKSSNYIKGYLQGYNNPKQSIEDMERFRESGKEYHSLSKNSKDYIDGKMKGIEDRRLNFGGVFG